MLRNRWAIVLIAGAEWTTRRAGVMSVRGFSSDLPAAGCHFCSAVLLSSISVATLDEIAARTISQHGRRNVCPDSATPCPFDRHGAQRRSIER
jgi:hypothetical protein